MRLPLLGQPYQGRGVIASAQRAVNVFAESNAGDPLAPVPITYYQTPGMALYADPNFLRNARCSYRTTIGTAYYVVGPQVYFLDAVMNLSIVGYIADRTSQVIMVDNGLCAVLTDGVNGYAIDMASNSFGQIIDPSFYGADYVAFLDTFFVFNRPATNQFYDSLAMATFGMLTNSAIDTGTISAAGLGYTNGTYTDVPLTGGAGVNATADITVAGGVVTAVAIIDPGYFYVVGNVLSADAANIGGAGAGFTYTISTLQTAFDPLDIAAKSGNADPIRWILAIHGELWLGGELTTEVWIGTGAADFYFQRQQGAFIDHGCIAQYSAATQDILGFWLMQDKQGKNIVVQGMGYDVSEISTPAIVKEFNSYVTTNDAIGFCFQIGDHSFYCLTFPQANKTWLYELRSKLWCEWAWTDANGNLNKHRANCAMYVYEKNLIGDWENGKIYYLDLDLYQDFGGPIVRVRTFMHLLDDGNEAFYNNFQADMEVGNQVQLLEADPDPLVSLSWSDNKGISYGNPVLQTMGRLGQFLTSIIWNNLGMARDRVFKLQWSNNSDTALNGAFVDIDPSFAGAKMKKRRR